VSLNAKEPLASRIRPESLDHFVGQSHLVGEGKPLRLAIEKKYLFSFILWGPPGSGKTTLARIYSRSLNAKMYELSAVSAGKKDIRDILSDDISVSKILFLDEIHRFNKAQQDFLLPFIESGEIYLVGATTENPSFEVISPLLSRCRVFVLHPLTMDDIGRIIDQSGFEIDKDAREWLLEVSDGDARRVLTLIESSRELYDEITVKSLKGAMQSIIRYDKKGEEHYNTISAFIKSMRASQPDAALHYLARMIKAGEDPKFIARRMVIFASEDIGMAQPTALVIANAVFQSVEIIGLPECVLNLAHGVIYLSECKKDRSSKEAYMKAVADVDKYRGLSIPMELRNPTTKLTEDIGYGKDYDKYIEKDLLPDKLKGRKYYIKKS